MNLAARYSAQNSAWYVTDTTGTYEIDSDVYDTEDEAKADFRYYEGMYAGEQKHQGLTDEEWHDMPLTGQDTVDTGDNTPESPLTSPVAVTRHLYSDHVASCACCPGRHVYTRSAETVESRERFDASDWVRNTMHQLPDGARFQITVQRIA